MQVRNIWLDPSKYAIKSPRITEKVSITVHNTGNSASAYNETIYMTRNNYDVSFHAVVDEKEVIQCIPWERCSFHSGKRKGNDESYSVEIARSTSSDESLFDRAERNGAIYIASLLKSKGWGVERLTTHQAWNGKYCPHKTLDRGWTRFVNMVKEELKNQGAEVIENSAQVGGYEVRQYKNGSTPEVVYQTSDFSNKIGMLNRWEVCDCIGEINGAYIVRYKIDGTNNYKVGFVKYHG